MDRRKKYILTCAYILRYSEVKSREELTRILVSIVISMKFGRLLRKDILHGDLITSKSVINPEESAFATSALISAVSGKEFIRVFI